MQKTRVVYKIKSGYTRWQSGQFVKINTFWSFVTHITISRKFRLGWMFEIKVKVHSKLVRDNVAMLQWVIGERRVDNRDHTHRLTSRCTTDCVCSDQSDVHLFTQPFHRHRQRAHLTAYSHIRRTYTCHCWLGTTWTLQRSHSLSNANKI